jgi:hypothetical protein
MDKIWDGGFSSPVHGGGNVVVGRPRVALDDY